VSWIPIQTQIGLLKGIKQISLRSLTPLAAETPIRPRNIAKIHIHPYINGARFEHDTIQFSVRRDRRAAKTPCTPQQIDIILGENALAKIPLSRNIHRRAWKNSALEKILSQGVTFFKRTVEREGKMEAPKMVGNGQVK
jgi:hypothetical protein